MINTPIFIQNSQPSTSLAGSLVLNNINLQNVATAVGVANGQVVLPGGTTTIESWGQGNVYSGSSSVFQFVQGSVPAPNKPRNLLDNSGKIFSRSHPQYEFHIAVLLSLLTSAQIRRLCGGPICQR